MLFGAEKPIPLSTGREWDKETGLYYYRARYYDPMEGRFISKDPASFFDGTNMYGYTNNNPINLVDSMGLAGTTPDVCGCFIKCWRKYINDNYGTSFKTALGLSYVGAVPIIQEIYNGLVSTAAVDKLKISEVGWSIYRW